MWVGEGILTVLLLERQRRRARRLVHRQRVRPRLAVQRALRRRPAHTLTSRHVTRHTRHTRHGASSAVGSVPDLDGGEVLLHVDADVPPRLDGQLGRRLVLV